MALFSLKGNSQNFYRYQFEDPWSITVHAGPAQYFGDLYSLWKYNEGLQPDMNISLTSRYTFGTHLKARFDMTYYQISGHDHLADPKSGRIPRNLNFRAQNYEGAFLIEYYWKPVKLINPARSFWNPYIFAGLGLSSNNPYADYYGQWISLRNLRTEGHAYPGTVFTFPMGVGLKYKLNAYIDLQLEANYRFTNTDYLDDVSVYNVGDIYKDLIRDYIGYEITDGNGETHFYTNPNRLRLAIRNPDFLLPNGEPDIDKIIANDGRIRRGSGSNGRLDGFMTFNVGIEIYLTHILRERLLPK